MPEPVAYDAAEAPVAQPVIYDAAETAIAEPVVYDTAEAVQKPVVDPVRRQQAEWERKALILATPRFSRSCCASDGLHHSIAKPKKLPSH